MVSRRARSLRDRLFNQKKLCLDTSQGQITTRCTPKLVKRVGHPCQACDLMSEKSELIVNGRALVLTGGDCKSFNLIYCAQCVHCGLAYLGKSVQRFSSRIAQHRGFITSIGPNDEINDKNTLAHHIMLNHSAKTREDLIYLIYLIYLILFLSLNLLNRVNS